MEKSRYFTLYFIPLFPTQTLGEYVQCGTCRASLKPGVLSLTREYLASLNEPWKCPACGNVNAPAVTACLSCRAPREKQPLPPPVPRVVSSSPRQELPRPRPVQEDEY